MRLNEVTAVEKAKNDLSRRLGVGPADVSVGSVSKTDFPDMALGASVGGEISAQMISTGWLIKLKAGGRSYEYRADKYHLRLVGFGGKNYVID
jgi:hypothetical protein